MLILHKISNNAIQAATKKLEEETSVNQQPPPSRYPQRNIQTPPKEDAPPTTSTTPERSPAPSLAKPAPAQNKTPQIFPPAPSSPYLSSEGTILILPSPACPEP